MSGAAGTVPMDSRAVTGEAQLDRDLMARALALYWPDIGLAIHRALEARQVARVVHTAPILDLGCSDGRFARLWTGGLPQPPGILGCDIRLPDLRHAAAGGGLAPVGADGRQLPLPNGRIATVIANSVLTHVPDVTVLLAEVARVLRPGGHLLAAVPGPAFEEQLAWVWLLKRAGFPWIARRLGDRYHLRWGQWHRDGAAVWRRRLAASGLTLVTALPYPGVRTGLVWSLAYGVVRIGFGRLTLLNILRKLSPGTQVNLPGNGRRPGLLTRILAPLAAESGAPGGSLFLVARKTDVPLSIHSGPSRTPRISTGIKRLDHSLTLEWLRRSRIRIGEGEAVVMTGGYGNVVDGRNGQAPLLYSEITGYATQFWLRQQGSEALALATAAGNCLLRAQVSLEGGRLAGSFPYGFTRPEGRVIPAYFSFDAGICASALADLARRTGVEHYAQGARRAAAFLLRMQAADGSFGALESPNARHPGLPRQEEWFGDHCALHGKNAIAFLKLWHLTGERQWQSAARRTLDWVCRLQGLRGEFPHFAGAALSMSHTHAYATEGLLYAGLALGEERYLIAGVRGAEWLRVAQRRDGALHRDYRMEGDGLPRPALGSPLHVGPVAQAARLWWVAAQVSPGRSWEEAASRALAFLARVQAPAGNVWGAGAFPQSARRLGPWLRSHPVYSAWEAMFACEAVRLWTTGKEDPEWSLF